MDFLALATDYDGTLAQDGVVQESTICALEKLRDSGRHLLLVSGRQLEDLLRVFPRHDLFEWIVAENGALLYFPKTRESTLLGEPVPTGLPEALRRRGVNPVGIGRSIVATWRPHECTVLDVLRDLGLDRQIIFNKNAVMILPTGVNKGSGMLAALKEIGISPHNLVGIGDAENDLPMLAHCQCSVSVSNALESVKAKSDMVTAADHGAGVEELIGELLRDDLSSRLAADRLRGLLLGKEKTESRQNVLLPSLGASVLVAGPSGSGKSTSITGLLERMASAEYQFCLFDPEGDYEGLEAAINLGNPHYIPLADEVLAVLERTHSVTVNLLGVALDNRPAYVSEVLRKLDNLRASKGRPHWYIFDEAHHIFPSESPVGSALLQEPPRTSLMLTVHPQHVRKEALAAVDIVIAVGKDPRETIRDFCRSIRTDAPQLGPVTLGRGEVLIWFRREARAPLVVTIEPGKVEHKRHIRKYAEGDMGEGSFVFTGPDSKLHLSAQNLDTFIRMASGVDDVTWRHHLCRHDYSRWFRSIIKDESLADDVEKIENEGNASDSTRESIFAAIRARYTAPN